MATVNTNKSNEESDHSGGMFEPTAEIFKWVKNEPQLKLPKSAELPEGVSSDDVMDLVQWIDDRIAGADTKKSAGAERAFAHYHSAVNDAFTRLVQELVTLSRRFSTSALRNAIRPYLDDLLD